jgi:hypothetical protein
MRLQHVCLIDLGYEGRFTFVKSQENAEGTGFGTGDGRAHGPRITGELTWASYPRRRADGVMEPEASGAITTEDGATILFSLRGRTITQKRDDGSERGGQLLHVTFESSDERYAWVNNALCVAEAVTHPGSLRLILGVHECLNEMVEKLP